MRSCVGLLLNYRDAKRSIRCIHSLLEQGCASVLVWDNSADDACSAMAITSTFEHDQRVVVEISAENLGFAAGVNRALQRCAPGAWVLLINNDARLLPGGLLRLASLLETTPATKIAFPNIDHAGRVLGQGYCHRWTGLLAWQSHHGYFPYASGCCLLIAMDRIGLPLFDEDFFMYGEDWELGWRLSQQPGATVWAKETLVEHDGTASSGLGTPFYESHMVAAHLILARKLARNSPDACLLHASRALMLIARACLRAIRFRSLIPFEALWAGAQIAFKRKPFEQR